MRSGRNLCFNASKQSQKAYRAAQEKILPPDTPGLCSLTRPSGVISSSLVANDRSVSLTNNLKPASRSRHDRNE
ncbi:hypothetical protein L596_022867 [Steinernema carpocapsae]|uniref:Uncharacterized protein n=1 Tax=Steinernema carpocapsae TaxID=34508 RepID=A0A4U5MCS1_STECR|nr:hypothetical protein L596_022867 [Steinernema carpocapsae]